MGFEEGWGLLFYVQCWGVSFVSFLSFGFLFGRGGGELGLGFGFDLVAVWKFANDCRWGDNSYGVSYVTGPSPTGPFSSTPTKILQGDDTVGQSTGHNSVFTPDGKDYYIVYHRRPVNDTERDHRVTCIDRMEFDEQGNILPVKITSDGVEGRPLA